MASKRIIARLDIKNEFVIKGVFLEGLRKVGTPSELAYKYYLDGVDEIILTDAVAALYDRNSLSHILKEVCKKIFVPITIGGGLRNLADIRNALNSGADKVAINTQAVLNPEFVKEAVRAFGSQAIVGEIVAGRMGEQWEVFINNARNRTKIEVKDWAIRLQDLGVGEIMVTSMDREGTKSGFDIDLLNYLAPSVKVPLIVSGGAGSSHHVTQLFKNVSCEAAAVASVLHYNLTSVRDIKSQLSKVGVQVRGTV
jgi:cyclase